MVLIHLKYRRILWGIMKSPFDSYFISKNNCIFYFRRKFYLESFLCFLGFWKETDLKGFFSGYLS